MEPHRHIRPLSLSIIVRGASIRERLIELCQVFLGRPLLVDGSSLYLCLCDIKYKGCKNKGIFRFRELGRSCHVLIVLRLAGDEP